MRLEVDADRITQQLQELAAFSETPPPAITRIVFSEPDLRARTWLKQLCRDQDLLLREDAAGNLFARWEGADADLAAVGTGSHIDAIPNSGQYDGTVGVLGGLEAIRSLKRAGFQPRRSIDLILFTSEEPTRFGIGCLGSRLLSGSLSPERASSLRDKEDKTLEEVRSTAGFRGPLADVALNNNTYSAFVELHIEQGPILEREQISIGVVTHIAAPASLRVTFRGQGGHAGAVLMPDRRDALVGASELTIAVEAAARNAGSRNSVATTGVLQVFPGAVNSVPSEAKLEIDIRDTELERRDGMVQQILSAATEIAGRRSLEVHHEIVNADAPAQCDPFIVSVVQDACDKLGYRAQSLISRAYHDSLFMARIAPTGMIFIPCRGGVSHRPDEYASSVDIYGGVMVLAQTLAKLAG